MIRSVDITSGDIDPRLSTSRHRDLALRANYESCAILESVVSKFVEDGTLRPPSAEHFLELLGEWSQVLPVSLRQRPRKGDSSHADSTYRERMIANVHVAGTYYFGIILVTRQFLIQHIMPQLGGGLKSKKRSRQNNDGDEPEAAAVAKLSHACIGAATYMAQMCREAQNAGVLLGNMCIIKAWVFAAGLVLGFALLADESSNIDSREAFRGSQEVLAVLGRLSAQAEQYHRILCAFSDAIDVYRRQMLRQQNEARLPYVEQILSYDAPADPSAQETDDAALDHLRRGAAKGAAVIDTGQTQDAQAQKPAPDAVQLPTPDFNVNDLAFGDADMWNDSMVMADFGPDDWPSAADNELMLRILWDGYTMNFDTPLTEGQQNVGI